MVWTAGVAFVTIFSGGVWDKTAQAANPDNYSVTSWKYKRTYQYGSPQFKEDGTTGIDHLAPSHAYLSKDGRGIFIGVPGMKPVMQMQIKYKLHSASGEKVRGEIFNTINKLGR